MFWRRGLIDAVDKTVLVDIPWFVYFSFTDNSEKLFKGIVKR